MRVMVCVMTGLMTNRLVIVTVEQPDLTVDEAHAILKKCRFELETRFLVRNGKWLYKVLFCSVLYTWSRVCCVSWSHEASANAVFFVCVCMCRLQIVDAKGVRVLEFS